ncbi:MFS transporter [Campylobacter geochelonis]|uniref:Multidrug-efflux transporter n=1 Tax=Campylobacter geochelonis TaxID=1780362 RepID=A0A128E9V5_9BACT|nr:MFS transporter [Campylobacter geochelonis]QKF72038.1 putative sugar transporter, major facilitator superfamily [Campylobacter geochelonis]CZE45774.1 multidrug-efflux transporter [Campylobacter geochelonis]CZE46857.1 multidrug-efflux transporter [Campylobacter geochelonis]CZE49875.1 multidrug-efflux transporter [Campylobacter geochelonis]
MLKTVLSLSFVVATRFFGLFILLPVISLYALKFPGANEVLVGVLIGIYALMQMIFQVPFGLLSDKIGRKHTMFIGLAIFIVGSLICGFTNDIYMMIFGRFLQGCGAIGAVATAMISDFTKEEERGKAMAIMGAMIGVAFASSMVLSPILSDKFGLASLFHISTALTVLCIVLLYTAVPKEVKIKSFQENVPLSEILSDKDLSLMNLTNFFQKMLMTMAFLAIPIVLVNSMGYPENHLYKVYSVAMVFGFLAMGFAGAVGEKRGLSKQILLLGIVFFILSYAIFAVVDTKFAFMVGVVLFFIGFNMHEPIMQSCASKFAKSNQKGVVLGVFNSAGYFGSFIGGVFGGFMMSEFGIHELAMLIAVIGIIWFLLLITLTNPALFKNIYFSKDEARGLDFASLNEQKGFIESYQKGDGFVVKYNSKLTNKENLYKILGVKNEQN